MDSNRIHFIRLAGAVRGPLALEDLRDLGQAGVVTPETELAASASGPWARLATLPLEAEVFPPRRVLGFKAAEFENVNRASGAAPVDTKETIEHALRPAASLRGKEVTVKPLGRRGAPDGEPLNEVQVIVQEVGRKVAEHAGPVALPGAIIPFPRWRWFAVAAGIGSAGMLLIPLCYKSGYDAMTVTILSGWVVLFNALLLGIMMLDRGLTGAVRKNKSKRDALK